MPVKIELEGEKSLFNVTSTENNGFELIDDKNRVVEVECPLSLDPLHKEKEFEVHFLAKKDVKENEIFQVFLRTENIRIGWLIPIISLSSVLHDYAENEHFLRYAYRGIKEALEILDSNIFSKSVKLSENSCRLEDIFHEETVLLVLSKDVFNSERQFEICKFSASLIKHGYVSLSKRVPTDIEIRGWPITSRHLYLDEISNEIDSYLLISELLNKSYSFEANVVFRFFYLYQIIELLIDLIYKREQEGLVEKLLETKNDSGKTKEVLDKMQRFMSEKKRIGLLINEYTNIASELAPLANSCNDFLASINRENSQEFSGYFYSIRNFIFHQYRDFPEDGEDILNEVLKNTLNVIPKLLASFSFTSKH